MVVVIAASGPRVHRKRLLVSIHAGHGVMIVVIAASGSGPRVHRRRLLVSIDTGHSVMVVVIAASGPCVHRIRLLVSLHVGHGVMVVGDSTLWIYKQHKVHYVVKLATRNEMQSAR